MLKKSKFTVGITILCLCISLFLIGCPEETEPDTKTYTVTAPGAITGGSIIVDKESAEEGDTVAITVTPESGYRLKAGSLEATGAEISVSAPYTFIMPASNVTVTGEFETIPDGDLETYTITAMGAITGGSITVDKTSAEEGDTVTITVTAANGYQLKAGSLEATGSTVSTTSPYTFTMPASDVIVSGEFEKVTYIVTEPGDITGGSITVDKESAFIGDVITITVTPESGYQLKAGTLSVTDTTAKITAPNTYTFTMPASNVTVTGEFETIPAGDPETYTITAPGAIIGGSITVDKTSAEANSTVTITVTTANGYQLKAGSLEATGSIVSTTSPYTFTMPASDVIVSGEFEKITYIVTEPGDITGGSITVDKEGFQSDELLNI